MKKLLSLFIPVIALIGLLDASYITYEKLSGIIPPCRPGFQCATVLTSAWSNLGPFPLSAYGAAYYLVVLIVGGCFFLEYNEVRLGGQRFSLHRVLLWLTAFGFIFSLYLVFIMAVVLQAWCIYCLVSAIVCVSLFTIVRLLSMVDRKALSLTYPLRLSLIAWLYQQVLKHIFFLLDPEYIHNQMVATGEVLGKFGFTRWITRMVFSYQDEKLTKTLAGIRFPNPVGLSAGFDYDAKLPDILADVGFGFTTIGTVTLGAYEGNTQPRLSRFPTSKALLVNKGFKNIGARAVIEKLQGRDFSLPTGISIGSTNKPYASTDDQIEDIIQSFSLFEKADVRNRYYELNISCPNTKGGQPFTDVKRLQRLIDAVDRLKIDRPIFVKMPIDLPLKDTRELLGVLNTSSVKGVIFGNLTKDHENPDVVASDRRRWNKMSGGVSGYPTFSRSNERIQLTRKHFKKRFVIIGTGGVFSGQDAKAKLAAGADLVQLITGMIYNGPQLIGQINWELANLPLVT